MSFLIRFARQWIAGVTLDEAVERGKKENNSGIGAIINFLGEHVRDKAEARRNMEENLKRLQEIESEKIRAALSIKLPQLGLLFDKNLLSTNVETIVSCSASNNIFVW